MEIGEKKDYLVVQSFRELTAQETEYIMGLLKDRVEKEMGLKVLLFVWPVRVMSKKEIGDLLDRKLEEVKAIESACKSLLAHGVKTMVEMHEYLDRSLKRLEEVDNAEVSGGEDKGVNP